MITHPNDRTLLTNVHGALIYGGNSPVFVLVDAELQSKWIRRIALAATAGPVSSRMPAEQLIPTVPTEPAADTLASSSETVTNLKPSLAQA